VLDMKVLFVTESLSLSKNTGVASTLVSLARSLTQDLHIELLAPMALQQERADDLFLEGLAAHLFPQSRFLPRTVVPELGHFLSTQLSKFNLVHIHGLWRYPQWAAAHYARKLSIPYIVSPHGMCEPFELARKGWKKKVFFNLVEKHTLQNAAAIHAITAAEKEHCTQLQIGNVIEVIPHGVTIQSRLSPSQVQANLPDEIRAIPPQAPVLLYMGRLHPKKGLDLLLPAFAQILSRHSSAYLVLAGPDVVGYQDSLMQLASSYQIEERVLFPGMVTGLQKQAMLQRADVFTLPSYSEGFSAAILEALAAAKPVVISKYCYFDEVVNAGCGQIVDTDVSQLASALNDFLELSPDVRQGIGQCGRRLIEEKYTWDLAAHKMSMLYQSILSNKATSIQDPSLFESASL